MNINRLSKYSSESFYGKDSLNHAKGLILLQIAGYLMIRSEIGIRFT